MVALQNTTNTKQCWLAYDASGAGSIKVVLKCWQSLEKMGPMFGYHPNALKCWLIVKPNKHEEAIEAFQNTGINVTTEGRRHLGAALGSRDFLQDYRDLTQLGRHRRGRRLGKCDLIDCITVFQSEFEKSFISCTVLVEFTSFLHFFAT